MQRQRRSNDDTRPVVVARYHNENRWRVRGKLADRKNGELAPLRWHKRPSERKEKTWRWKFWPKCEKEQNYEVALQVHAAKFWRIDSVHVLLWEVARLNICDVSILHLSPAQISHWLSESGAIVWPARNIEPANSLDLPRLQGDFTTHQKNNLVFIF